MDHKDEDLGQDWPTIPDAAIFWAAVIISVMVTSVGAMEVMRWLGWIQ